MNNDLVRRVAVLKVVSDYTSQLYNDARAAARPTLSEGSRIPVRTPDGDKIATVSMTDPVSTARIADERAFEEWARDTYPDRVTTAYAISGTDAAVKRVLFEHAPHLLKEYRVVDPELVKEVRRASAKFGVPVGPDGETDVPGVVVECPKGTVTCRADDDALAVVIQLFRSGQLSFETLDRAGLPDGVA